MIDTAILLAAGEGSRLRPAAPFKPLCPVAGRPLIAHALHGLAAAGMTRAIVVLGYGAEEIEAFLATGSWPLTVGTVRVADYRKPNGSSLLAAEPLLKGREAVLAMCDHLVDPALYRRLAEAGAGQGARLGIDRRLGHDWVDPDDVTCVRTEGEMIVAIGKGLEPHDCYDTGVFAIGPALLAALRTLDAPSLTEGMRILAAQGAALTLDCSDLDWIDVDDAPALAKAEAWLADR
ncbi:phosphocholine cytidylyltransferase family protein [Sphingomonas koreensis]